MNVDIIKLRGQYRRKTGTLMKHAFNRLIAKCTAAKESNAVIPKIIVNKIHELHACKVRLK